MTILEFQRAYGGLSNDDMARLLGCSRQAVLHWKSGRRRMPDTIERFLRWMDHDCRRNPQEFRAKWQRALDGAEPPAEPPKGDTVIEQFENAMTGAVERLMGALDLHREQDRMRQAQALLEETIAERTRDLERVAGFERMVSRMLARFMRARTERLPDEFRRMVRTAGEFFAVDSVHLALLSPEALTIEWETLWRADPAPTAPPSNIGRPSVGLPAPAIAYRRHGSRVIRAVVDGAATNLSEMERSYLEGMDARSALLVPLVHAGRPIGFLAAAARSADREWPKREADGWALLGDIVTQAAARRQANRLAREAHELILTLINAPLDGAYLLEADGRMLAANQSGLALAGIQGRAPEPGTFDVLAALPATLGNEARMRMREVMASGTPITFKTEQDARTYELTICPARNPEGAATRCALFVEDVTDHERSLVTLRQLDRVIGLSRAMVFRWRAAPGFPVEFASETVRQLGYTPEDFLSGKVQWPAITHPDDVIRLEAELAGHAAANRHEFSMEYRLTTAWGEVRRMADTTRALLDAGGRITHYQSVIIDVQAGAQGPAAGAGSRAPAQPAPGGPCGTGYKASLLEGMLLAIRDMATADPSENAAGSRPALARIRGAAFRASRLAARLTADGEPATGQDIRELLQKAGEVLTAGLPPNVVVELDHDASGHAVTVVDAARLEHAVASIVASMADAMPAEGGVIAITVAPRPLHLAAHAQLWLAPQAAEGPSIAVAITAAGKYMAAAELTRFFEAATPQSPEDAAFGIASVLEVMREHRGAVAIESTTTRGTTVTLYFPAPRA